MNMLIIIAVVVILLIAFIIINLVWGTFILGILTAIYHFFKKEKPAKNTNFNIEQGKEVK